MIVPSCKYQIKDVVRIKDTEMLEKLLLIPLAVQLEAATNTYMKENKERQISQIKN